MRAIIFLTILPFMVFASESLDDEIIKDLDFYQNLGVVQESKNVIDISFESMELVTEDKISNKVVSEKGN